MLSETVHWEAFIKYWNKEKIKPAFPELYFIKMKRGKSSCQTRKSLRGAYDDAALLHHPNWILGSLSVLQSWIKKFGLWTHIYIGEFNVMHSRVLKELQCSNSFFSVPTCNVGALVSFV